MSTSAVARREGVDTSTGEIIPLAGNFDMTDFLARLSSPAAIEQQKALATAYDAACRALLGTNDVQKEGDREFKKKSAWRKLGRYFVISTRVMKIEREWLGDFFIATVTAEARAPWGQSAESVGACSTDEEQGNRVITIADAIATAETRATNRAVSNLIAMGEVSAEEMTGKGAEGQKREPKPVCPKCGGPMWDNRAKKASGEYSAQSPDFACKNKKTGCDGKLWPGAWPPKEEKKPGASEGEQSAGPTPTASSSAGATPTSADSTKTSSDRGTQATQPSTATTEVLTRDSPLDFGTFAGTTLANTRDDFLEWALDLPETRIPEKWRALFAKEPDSRMPF